jgi:ribokinase
MAAVVVIGSANMDATAMVDRLPEPGETVLSYDFFTAAGGKGLNQAVAAARQGAAVTLVASVGDDEAGRTLVELMETEGIETAHVQRHSSIPTGVAHIAVEYDGDNTVIVVPLANAAMTVQQVEAAADALTAADVVLTQLECPMKCIVRAMAIARQGGAITVLNPAPAQPLPAELIDVVDILVVNQTEATMLGKVSGPDIIETLGAEGARFGDRVVPALAADVIDPTGAGDAFCGTLAAALASGLDRSEAVVRAVAAGALAVERDGAVPSLPTAVEVEARIRAAPSGWPT